MSTGESVEAGGDAPDAGAAGARELDAKLERIRGGRYSGADFVIADAKDGDMAFGITSPGPDGQGGWKPRSRHLDAVREMTRSGLVDIMLVSVSTAERLHEESLFEPTRVTPAVRLNDTTDVWCARGSHYRESPSRPFASADVASASGLCDLGLYSMTFQDDHGRATFASLEAYRAFRLAAPRAPDTPFPRGVQPRLRHRAWRGRSTRALRQRHDHQGAGRAGRSRPISRCS